MYGKLTCKTLLCPQVLAKFWAVSERFRPPAAHAGVIIWELSLSSFLGFEVEAVVNGEHEVAGKDGVESLGASRGVYVVVDTLVLVEDIFCIQRYTPSSFLYEIFETCIPDIVDIVHGIFNVSETFDYIEIS